MTDRALLRQALGAIKAARQSHIDFDYKPHEGYMLETIGKLEAALAQPEQEPCAWRNAAIRLGEDLHSVGPDGYYDMTAKQWLDWALSVVNIAQHEQEHIECGYDETVGMCTNNPCCEQTPVSHLWECIGRWSAYLAANGKQGNLAPPTWLVDAVKAATAPPEQTKYSDIVSDGGLDPRNKFDAQPEQAAVPFPSFMRRRIEQAMEDAIHPKGMSVHDSKATVLVSDLHRMLLIIDSTPPSKAWVSLSDTEINKIVDLNTSDNGGFDIWCDGIAVARIVCAKLKEKNA